MYPLHLAKKQWFFTKNNKNCDLEGDFLVIMAKDKFDAMSVEQTKDKNFR